MSRKLASSHEQYNQIHMSSGGGTFPLRPNYFRSLPLARRARDELYAEAKENARACLRLAFNDQWRYVPPEKDGAQVRKDTSNLAESRRLVRAATVLRCQEHEVSQVLANTSSESWREFARKCCGKFFVDSLVLHAVRSPSCSASSSMSNNHDASSGSEGDEDCGARRSHCNNHIGGIGRPPIRLVDDDCLSEPDTNTPKRIPRRSSEVSTADMRARAHHNRWTGAQFTAPSSNQDEREVDPDGLGEDADELLTVKWGAFETGIAGKRDLCVVDYLSLACVPSSDDDADSMEQNNSARERVHAWCFTSVDGERVGCMQLRETHGVRRTNLPRFGVFWRKNSPSETEVIVCGSFPSRHAPAASTILLTCLSRLQSIVEDLRLSNQAYLPRSAWVNDRDRSSCRLCMRNFFALRRKHHCRKCGEVLCSDCSTVESIDLPGIGYSKIRMCKVCSMRARSTPLEEICRENLFDRLVRVRSASNLLLQRSPSHSASGSGYLSCAHRSRRSFSENKRSDRFDNTGSGSSSGSDAVPVSAAAMARSTRGYSGGCNNQVSGSEDEQYEFADSDVSNLSERATAVLGAVVYPMPEPDDYIDARSLKRQLTAMEAKKRKENQEKHDESSSSKGGDMFDLLCELACQTISCPIASVCVVDDRGESISSSVGLKGKPNLDRELAVFIDKVMGSSPKVVLDANVDAQARAAFHSNPPSIRFFAGSPIYSRSGRKLGYVCVADLTKRDMLGPSCAFTMERLASLAVTTMERNIGSSKSSCTVGSNNQTSEDGSRRGTSKASDVELLDVELVYEVSPMPRETTSAHRPMASDYDGTVLDAQERMRKLLLKSYHTQQQLAANGSPTVQPSTPPPF